MISVLVILIGASTVPCAQAAQAVDYSPSPPIWISGMHGTPQSPIVIEGLDVSAAGGNAVTVIDSSYVIVRGNRIHNTTTARIDDGPSGNAIWVQDSSHIEIVDNVVADNLRGISIQATPGSPHIDAIAVHGNHVTGSRADAGILVRGAEAVDIHDNTLDRNGDAGLFDRHRITGIEVWDSSHVRIHSNVSTHSSSDGVGVATSKEVLLSGSGYVCSDVEIYDNISRGNGEQGIWLSVVHGGSVHGNTIQRNANADPALGSSGIRLESSVNGFDIYDNTLSRNEVAEISISASSGNDVHDNMITPGSIGVLIDGEHEHFQPGASSTRNRIHNNVIVNGPIGFRMHAGERNQFVNNTVVNMGQSGILIDSGSRGSTVANNIVVGSQHEGLADDGVSSRIITNLYFRNGIDLTGSSPHPGDLFANPRFVSAGQGDFRLRRSSPARGAGDRNFTYCRRITAQKRPDMGAVCSRTA